mmetsp:Transcript_41878/g.125346  ORF Transcript_41878/g.125346 Transcript_41878/m.125346 type:complete len:224 (+) Transcript_41878:691-1362(+)
MSVVQAARLRKDNVADASTLFASKQTAVVRQTLERVLFTKALFIADSVVSQGTRVQLLWNFVAALTVQRQKRRETLRRALSCALNASRDAHRGALHAYHAVGRVSAAPRLTHHKCDVVQQAGKMLIQGQRRQCLQLVVLRWDGRGAPRRRLVIWDKTMLARPMQRQRVRLALLNIVVVLPFFVQRLQAWWLGRVCDSADGLQTHVRLVGSSASSCVPDLGSTA